KQIPQHSIVDNSAMPHFGISTTKQFPSIFLESIFPVAGFRAYRERRRSCGSRNLTPQPPGLFVSRINLCKIVANFLLRTK
ncbi:hypothetical protein CFP56_037170, partial [Quercus suber]